MDIGDLAPLVAATLRDRVVDDLREEIRNLRADNERLRAENDLLRAAIPWTVQIVGADDATVYATGELPLCDWLDNDDSYTAVEVKPEEGAATCRVDDLSACRILVTRADGLGPDWIIDPSDTLDGGVIGEEWTLFTVHNSQDGDDAWVSIEWPCGDYKRLLMSVSLIGRQVPPSWNEAEFACDTPRELVEKVREVVSGDAPVHFISVELDTVIDGKEVMDLLRMQRT